MKLIIVFAVLLIAFSPCRRSAQSEKTEAVEITVGAAANLTDAFQKLE